MLFCVLQAVKLKPRFCDAYNNLASAYMQLGHTQEAIETYQVRRQECTEKGLQHLAAVVNSFVIVYFAVECFVLATGLFSGLGCG